jgi:hypothetical protein
MRQRRDDATASKVFFFVVINEEGWGHNAHGRVALQDIHGVESRQECAHKYAFVLAKEIF